MKRIELELEAARRSALGPERFGQALFNVAYGRWPAIVNNLRGSSADPFHNDSAADCFLAALGRRGVFVAPSVPASEEGETT